MVDLRENCHFIYEIVYFSFSTMILDFLMATTSKFNIPLYTIPCPPPPTSRVLSKLFVAFSSTGNVRIILSLMSAFCEISRCNSNPWFWLKNVCLILFSLRTFIFLDRKGAPTAMSKRIVPLPTPSPMNRPKSRASKQVKETIYQQRISMKILTVSIEMLH